MWRAAEPDLSSATVSDETGFIVSGESGAVISNV